MLEAQQLKESKVNSANTGGPAFPFGTAYAGMTLRDYFAAKAMQGILAADTEYEIQEENAAEMAYRQADAMLAERSK